MVKILDELPFDSDGRFTADPHFTTSLDEAISLYSESRHSALDTLYKSREFTQTKSMEMQADFEEVAASCGYFSFSLQDFASEIKVYLEILDDLRLEVEERPSGRSWSWLKFWRSARFHRARTEGEYDLLSMVAPAYIESQIRRICSTPTMQRTYLEIYQHRPKDVPHYPYPTLRQSWKHSDLPYGED